MSLVERLHSHLSASTTRGSAVLRHPQRLSRSKRVTLRRHSHVCNCKELDTAAAVSPAAEAVIAPVEEQVLFGLQQQYQAEIIDESLVKTRFIAETLLPTRHGNFRLRGYKHSVDGGISFTEPTAIINGQVEGQQDVTLRVHDACFTSEVLGSLKCDCAEQLQLALDFIQDCPPGMVIYLQQEGRGIGLANKIAAYSLQEQGLDTVDANRALGLPDDCREYTSVRNILRDLGVKSVRLMTNNPRKINTLETLGIPVVARIPCIVQAGQYNQNYLEAKRSRMDHLLDGSWCYWNHDGEPSQPTATAHSAGGMGLPAGYTTREGRVAPLGEGDSAASASSSSTTAAGGGSGGDEGSDDGSSGGEPSNGRR